ncbi:cytochrome c oxidase assembly protein [Azospirillum sp. RWY-5-1]|uniref:Cytochrome c oxidase assembly protein CtaG n=1 Tax=Azospirillum oleiclasticum TaxID=2735135 RepID=A0ABX2T8D9_9PROT|nr:cytochrome c oxidase assembly protein [Azospirillum oleiclasticum]NYZ13387.1 cytochrome c oxidase assembly protein [Azospirillum oleiclasticum]NYZ20548.1 cytochrome c oxidase assembly protein [Azospirillum oleiclasticum]
MDEGVKRRNLRLMGACFVLVAGMTGLAFASVPLYDLFCKVTGFGGTTQRADAAPAQAIGRTVAVRFNADVNGQLPWSFRPVDREITVALGEQQLTSYRAANRAGQAMVGTATFNVTPDKAGKYFNKIQCFCFNEQILEPGREVDMPVLFFVDPAMAKDPDMDDVTTITLSYTFFRALDEKKVLAQTAARAGGAESN